MCIHVEGALEQEALASGSPPRAHLKLCFPELWFLIQFHAVSYHILTARGNCVATFLLC